MRNAVLIVDMQPICLYGLEEQRDELVRRIKCVVEAADLKRIPIIYFETYFEGVSINDDYVRTLEELGRGKNDTGNVLLKYDSGIVVDLNYAFRDINRLFLMGVNTGTCFTSTLSEVSHFGKKVNISPDTTADADIERYHMAMRGFHSLNNVTIHPDYQNMIRELEI